MLTEVSHPEERIQFADDLVISLVETAETINENALNRAGAMMPARDRQNGLAGLLARPDFTGYFNYALAIEIARVIASYDRLVQSVYLFEESANPDALTEEGPTSRELGIHLLAFVTSASAALEAFVNSLDRTLTVVLNEHPSEAFAGRTSFLNVIPITENDVKERRGYAVLLSSIYARPVKIWQRA